MHEKQKGLCLNLPGKDLLMLAKRAEQSAQSSPRQDIEPRGTGYHW